MKHPKNKDLLMSAKKILYLKSAEMSQKVKLNIMLAMEGQATVAEVVAAKAELGLSSFLLPPSFLETMR